MSAWRNACHCLLVSGALWALGGCYKATFVNPSVAPGPQVEEWTDFYVAGLVGREEFDVRRFCPGEVAMIRTGGNVATELVTAITFGIYAPRKLYVACAAPTQPTAPPALPSSAPPAPPLPAIPAAPSATPAAPSAPAPAAPSASAPAAPSASAPVSEVPR